MKEMRYHKMPNRAHKFLGFASLLSLIFNILALCYPTSTFIHSHVSLQQILQWIWIPASPTLALWLTATIAGFKAWRPITILVFLMSYFIGHNCVNNILHISSVTGSLYWIALIASWTALITLFINLYCLLFWIYESYQNNTIS